MGLTRDARFWAKVDKGGPIPEQRPDLGNCWIWVASKSSRGYGWFYTPERGVFNAHTYLVGPAGEGFEWDHLCTNTSCVRPSHLERVPGRINTLRSLNPMALNARKTHCPQGHEYSERLNSKGSRICRTCQRAANQRWAEKVKAS